MTDGAVAIAELLLSAFQSTVSLVLRGGAGP